MWHDVIWYDMWYYGMGIVWYDTVWCGVVYGIVWYIPYGMVWHGMIWCDMVHGVIYGMVESLVGPQGQTDLSNVLNKFFLIPRIFRHSWSFQLFTGLNPLVFERR